MPFNYIKYAQEATEKIEQLETPPPELENSSVPGDEVLPSSNGDDKSSDFSEYTSDDLKKPDEYSLGANETNTFIAKSALDISDKFGQLIQLYNLDILPQIVGLGEASQLLNSLADKTLIKIQEKLGA